MILGLYEKEVTEEIIRSSNDYRIFIDVGAADGYFAVSVMLNDLFEKCFAYDIDQMARKNIRSLSELNKIQERVKIFSTFNCNSLADLDLNEKCLILIDIEGEEYNLLDENTFKNFIFCKIIVELHEFDPQSNDKIAQLIYNSRSTHTFKYLEMGERDLSKIPEIRFLSDNDRWLLCSEGRPYLMRWIVFEPN